MPHDAELVAATRAWLQRAEEDLQLGEVALRSKKSLANGATFHAQQAVEKAMKGFLTWHASVFGKTHLLAEIGRACCGIDPTLEAVVRRAVPLTEYAWKSRYPGDWSEPTREEAVQAVKLAQSVLSAILARVPEEAHPLQGSA